MFDFIAWVMVGVVVGWVCSLFSGSTPPRIRLLNRVVGVAGAFIAGLILTPLFGAGLPQEGTFSVPALVVALLGAIGLVLVLNPVRRGATNSI